VPELVGILNLTRDSFSDGGRFVDPERAVEHAHRLAADGAAWIDVGAESTHPDAETVAEALELERLSAVVPRLLNDGLRVSVDTWKPGVMRRMLALGCGMINDVRALRTSGAVEAVRDSDALLVLMHSTSPGARATRAPAADATGEVVGRIHAFFAARLDDLAAAGIAPERVLLDPGLGLFLSPDPAPSLRVLRELPRLAALGRPLYVCTSKKSFLGALTGRDVADRGAATLASELFACRRGAAYVRTHDVRALADGLAIEAALGAK
jgi:dihydropteroate synthase